MPGGPELMVIMLVALLILGPDQLPKAMRTLGNARNEIKKVTGGFQAEIRKAMEDVDPRAEPPGRTAPPTVDAVAAPTRPDPVPDPSERDRSADVPVDAAPDAGARAAG